MYDLTEKGILNEEKDSFLPAEFREILIGTNRLSDKLPWCSKSISELSDSDLNSERKIPGPFLTGNKYERDMKRLERQEMLGEKHFCLRCGKKFENEIPWKFRYWLCGECYTSVSNQNSDEEKYIPWKK